MKKLFKLPLFAMSLFVVALATVSCGPEITPPPPPEDKTMTITPETSYGAVVQTANDLNHTIVRFLDGVTETQNGLTGDGYQLDLYFLSTASEEMKLIPGTYPVSPEFVAGNVLSGEFNLEGQGVGSMVSTVTNGQTTATEFVVGGEIKITENGGSFTVEATLDIDGDKKATLTFSGAIDIQDQRPDPFKMEPTERVDLTPVYTKAVMVNYGNALGYGKDVIVLEMLTDGEEEYLAMYLIAPLGTKDFNHAYTYNGDGKVADWVFVPGGFSDQAGPSPSYYMTTPNAEVVYYAVSGTINVAADKIDVDVTTGRGSTVKGTFTGAYTVEQPKQAPMKAAANKFDSQQIAKIKAFNAFR